MKKLMTFFLLASGIACGVNQPLSHPERKPYFECRISCDKTVLAPGEAPGIKTEIINHSGAEVYMIGSLDASGDQWRMPYCYFTVETPARDSFPSLRDCAMMNALRKEDFVRVPNGASFDPFMQVDEYGFFGWYFGGQYFMQPGKYKIQFHYSSKSTVIGDYRGDKNKPDLVKLFEKVPHVELESNVLEFEVK